MKRLLLLVPLMATVSSCGLLSHKEQTVKACKDILVPSLLDIDSYRERSDYKTIQSEKDNPVVYGWEWNSKNSMGGYTQPNLQLCYRDKDGEIITQNFELDDDIGIEVFLRATNPTLQKKEQQRIAKEQERVAKEKAAEEDRKRQIAEAEKKAEEAAQRRLEAARRAQAARQAEEQEKRRREEEWVRTAKSSLKSYCNSLNGRRPNYKDFDLMYPTTSEDMIHEACLSGNYDYFALNMWKQIRQLIR